MELQQSLTTSTPLPPLLANPAAIEGVVRRRTKTVRPAKTLEDVLTPSLLPAHIQLGREHLDGLREEISAAEDVLLNVYEDMTVFNTRQSALNEVTHLLVRMRYEVDSLAISLTRRSAIKREIDNLAGSLDRVVETTHHRSIPLLKPIRRPAPFAIEGRIMNRADVVFVVNRAEWMSSDVRLLARNLPVLFYDLKNRGIDARFGVQTFERSSQPSGPMRDGLVELASDFGAIHFGGIGCNALTAVRESLTDHSFRADSNKFVFLVSDTEAHDDYGSAREDTAAFALENGATVFVLSGSDRFTGFPHPVYEDLTSDTGGVYLNMNLHSYEETLGQVAGFVADRVIRRGAPVVDSMDRYIHIGPESTDTLMVRFPDFRLDTLGLRDLPLDTESDFRTAVARIDAAVGAVTSDRGEKGIIQSYLQRILEFFDGIRVFKLDFHI